MWEIADNKTLIRHGQFWPVLFERDVEPSGGAGTGFRRNFF